MKIHCKKARKNISLAMDSRLGPDALEQLQAHLQICPDCQSWRSEQLRVQRLNTAPEMIEPSPGFYAQLQNKISKASSRPRLFYFYPAVSRPALLRAALFLILIFSALLGFFLGGRLEAPAAGDDAAAFNMTMNLDAFSDLPGNSFGAVYNRLLQGELQ